MIRTSVLVVIWCASSVAHAQLRDPVSTELLADGMSLHASGDVLGVVGPADSSIEGDVAAVATWSRDGVDRTEGFRGPRWTNRWGAQLAARVAAGSSEHPIELEQRSELAIYLASVGQTVAWRVRPRMTDRLWWSANQLVVGGFVDFPGLGLIKEDGGDDMSCEGFPIYLSVARSNDASTTIEAELAAARVVGRPGDVRLINHRATVRATGVAKAIAWDFEGFSARNVELARSSPWRMSGGLGLSVVRPLFDSRVDLAEAPSSIIPLVRIGIEHRSDGAQIQARRSEIGRPLVDNADFGVELGTLHRFVDAAGVDAGGQLAAWWRHPLTNRVSVRSEGMLGVAARRLQLDPMSTVELPGWIETSDPVFLTRLEVSIAAKLARGFSTEARVWTERSERSDPTVAARWDHGAQAGLSWRH